MDRRIEEPLLNNAQGKTSFESDSEGMPMSVNRPHKWYQRPRVLLASSTAFFFTTTVLQSIIIMMGVSQSQFGSFEKGFSTDLSTFTGNYNYTSVEDSLTQ